MRPASTYNFFPASIYCHVHACLFSSSLASKQAEWQEASLCDSVSAPGRVCSIAEWNEGSEASCQSSRIFVSVGEAGPLPHTHSAACEEQRKVTSVANLVTFSLNLATFQTLSSTFFLTKATGDKSSDFSGAVLQTLLVWRLGRESTSSSLLFSPSSGAAVSLPPPSLQHSAAVSRSCPRYRDPLHAADTPTTPVLERHTQPQSLLTSSTVMTRSISIQVQFCWDLISHFIYCFGCVWFYIWVHLFLTETGSILVFGLIFIQVQFLIF